MQWRLQTMDPLVQEALTRGMTTSDLTAAPLFRPDTDTVRKAIAKRSFCSLATTSERGRPHSAGVLYQFAEDALFVSTLRSSRKARNLAQNPHVGVFVPIRRLPVGPPSSVQFQAAAEVLGADDPELRRHVEAGRLGAITGHGELDLPDGCFLRIPLPARLHTYGLGMSLRQLLRDPLGAAGIVELESA